MKNIFTTAAPIGVVTRDIALAISAIVTMLGALGTLDQDQVKTITEQAPLLMIALGGVGTSGVMIYRALTKSSSDRGAEVAKVTDAQIPPSAPVVVETPGNANNIVVEPPAK